MSMIEWSLSDLHMQKYQILNITRFELKTINVRAYALKMSEIARYRMRKPWTNLNITQLYQVRISFCGVLTHDNNINQYKFKVAQH